MNAANLPDGLPELRRGSHVSPRDGACLMEYVSVLAGEQFTDRPRCVDPLLVRLAWAVNDTVSRQVRVQLPPLALRFIGTSNTNPLTAPTVVAACCAYSLPFARSHERSALLRAKRRAEARIARVRQQAAAGRRPRGDRFYRLLQAEPPLPEAVRAVAAVDTGRLPQLLEAAVVAVENVLHTDERRAASSRPDDVAGTNAPSRHLTS